MKPIDQLSTYINQSLANGISPEAIARQLRQSGWSEASIRASLKNSPNYPQQPAGGSMSPQAGHPHGVRNGVLWILSPYLLLIGAAILEFLIRWAGIHSPIINIVGILAGVAAIILIPVGLIVGIIKLSHHQ